jgi:hypothetical protein
MTLFDPVFAQNQLRGMLKTDVDFVTVHGILFSKKNFDRLPATRDGFLSGLAFWFRHIPKLAHPVPPLPALED